MQKDKLGMQCLTMCFLAFFLLTAVCSYGSEYAALDSVKEIKAVFDVRSDKIKSTALQLDLIRRTFQDENIKRISDAPQFAVVFAGPATKLISGDREKFTAEEQKQLAQMDKTIAALDSMGIRLEVCMFAAGVFGVEASSIPAVIQQVPNGWISLIGYQARNYSLIAIY